MIPLREARRLCEAQVSPGRSFRRPLEIRRWVAAAVGIALVWIGAGCQDNEVDNNQVCAFQCDYQQDAAAAAARGLTTEARLTEVDVIQVITNAIVEARANGITDLTISVHDHLNNVLAVFDTNATTLDYSRITSVERPSGEDQTLHDAIVGTDTDVNFATRTPTASLATALDGVFIPAGYAAMSKAGTANYFSTQGNAFSTRTANTLIQQNFVPGETDRPGGPLFAVQIAQLACSDINTKQIPDDPTDLVGPRRLPVGFAADPGGIPLYKDGIAELDANGNSTGKTGKVVVGSVGIEFNGIYSLDKDATDKDRNMEERIAVGASRGFEADPERTANRITVAGRALRFFDDGGLRSRPIDVPVVTAADIGAPGGTGAIEAAYLNAGVNAPPIGSGAGAFVYDPFFFPFGGVDSGARDGVFFLNPESGVVAATLVSTASGRAANGEIITDGTTTNRFPAIDTTVVDPTDPPVPADPANPQPGDGLSAEDVQELLVDALLLAERTRAQTRTPLGGQARIDVAVTDLNGVLLGFARSKDALLDGVDVTIAKTRTSGFWSKVTAQEQIRAAADPLGAAALLNAQDFDLYINNTATFLGEASPPATTQPPFNGDVAWSAIALGAISNPDFPPGVLDADEGPLSRMDGEWSIFSTGIQTEVVLPGIALALCEAVPDLAFVLSQIGGGAGDPTVYDIDGAGDLDNVAFCQGIRTAVGLPADPFDQPDCLQGGQDALPDLQDDIRGLQNGFHIFQGAVPIYRGSTLVGSFGVSGDGAEQDDFVPFVGLDNVFRAQRRRGVANPIGNAPKPIRADNISVQNINLRYVVCPVAPLLDDNNQTVCSGL